MLRVGDADQWRVQERDPLRGAIDTVSATGKPRLASPELSPVSVAGEPYCRHWRTSLPSPENSSDDPPELLAAAGAVAGAGSKSQLLRVVIPSCLCCCENVWGCALKLPLISS
ncbi:uncharacterized protein LOC107637916 [Arachis ipaensis]|uniref:uncharacterized protein LOC107637916 n=1 Tax=Arachis ipaensis TaxID=130454 RepID=UPI000A2B6889|nr:uncharacterized protein LOC107637916 [Arachis ipaensis]